VPVDHRHYPQRIEESPFTVFAVVWPLSLAWMLSYTFYQFARGLGY